MKRFSHRFLSSSVAVLILAHAVFGAPAEPARLAARGLLLDITRAGDRLVAVGAQGIVVTSDDNGMTWNQSAVPTQGMLTAVSFATAELGWAVGHRGTMIASVDGGASWRIVSAPVGDDDSFLDVLAIGPGHTIAVGAYGLFLETTDAGTTWTRRKPSEDDMHLNRITRGRSGRLYLAGESGTLARSDDLGQTWDPIDAPYEGSFYGLHELASGRLLAHGLRGHVFSSDDEGSSWTQAEIDHPVLFMTAVEAGPGLIALTSTGGHLYVSRDDGAHFIHEASRTLMATSEMISHEEGWIVVVGDRGAQRVKLP